ncbi:PhzF family phenazine biosynthesis protein [Sphingomonas astaxanthinifaciens]|uniref:Isomerase n=1 Tax=Sphingomonas astaxanthinifaciens DSM 22298 TaxID=1123267 RepID=A0ABQ5Z304_9SPHN|nr:PhzF family phenazine biosynthesis protein [Sphingomonas astaxanthinifaciens]GLR47158.1 putative isomerase [Sphingomonas astaxanthinifaciens DSM 22298]
MIIPFFQVDAFAPEPLTGNPAAVMPLEEWLPDATLQAIAAENNLSETAFTVPAEGDADYELRWFTPTTEVPMCGHATIASGHILITGEEVRFRTRKAGILTVRRDGEEQLQLSLPAASVAPRQAPEALAALGVAGQTFVGRNAEQTIIVLLDDEASVRAVRPDFAALRGIDALVIVTACGDEQEIASRVFAANVGIDEDPVTGAAHAALVPFWAARLERRHFSAAQVGPRGGVLDCRLEGDRVLLSGRCRTVIEGSFQL